MAAIAGVNDVGRDACFAECRCERLRYGRTLGRAIALRYATPDNFTGGQLYPAGAR
jgi:hypothetical protein